MSKIILVIGSPGSGKTVSLRNLPKESTYLINCIGKDLPYPGWKKQFVDKARETEENPCNMFVSYKAKDIITCINHVAKNRPEIKTLIIDDIQYVMAFKYLDEGMAKANSFELFKELGMEQTAIYQACRNARKDGANDLTTYILSHSEVENGNEKIKTVGKLVDAQLCPEGLTTLVLYSCIKNEEHVFRVKNSGSNTGRAPMGMFKTEYVPNDLYEVDKLVQSYGE